MVTSAQLRAARSLLDWTVRDLSEKAGVHRNTVTGRKPKRRHMAMQLLKLSERSRPPASSSPTAGGRA